MAYEQIATAIDKGVMTLTLNRPEKMNAFTGTMMSELIDVFEKVNKDDEVRAVVVTGAGKAFCAGADLSAGAKTFDYDQRADRPDKAGAGRGGNIDWSSPKLRDGGGMVTLKIFECLKPVIGAINGAGVGIGATMQLPMDVRLASSAARFGFVFARRGIVPEACSSYFLPRLVGISRALEWTMTGRIFGADEAKAAGLVRDVYAPEDLLPAAYGLAREIAENTSAVSIALTRQMLWRMLGADHPMEAHKIDSRGVYATGQTPDAIEGVMSFLEKRAPHFPGKVSADLPAFFPWWSERGYS
ncbi:MAG TPA: enoyl-CoA hydratase [Alphaproteobacteria bacterium]|nr:enoyl-CoA hydratase [Alphaproteobacteria bacterium]HAJ47056.1 enoyl-CoA hydratase [Alphaproteobacteria bacterium]